MYILYWDTNQGVVYFMDRYEQTFNSEEAKRFKTTKSAKIWFKKEFGIFGVNVEKV